MTIKPEPALNPPCVLDKGGAVQLSGRDALAFAQAQFANDVTLLADGQWQWSLWLSAKGRVQALFALVRLDAQHLLLWLPDLAPEAFAEQLQRFRFRSKVEIGALADAQATIGFEAPARWGFQARGSHADLVGEADGGWTRIVLDMGGTSPRTLCLDRQPGSVGQTDAGASARWRLDDLAHGLPRLDAAGSDAFTPQMLGLDRLAAFSVKKGCYPGQEIVARTHFLGQTKRGPLRLALAADLAPGTALSAADGAVAQLVSVAQLGERIEALAVGPIQTQAQPWHAQDGSAATVLPLLDGLAR
jgi:folate-binding protein YgfZ